MAHGTTMITVEEARRRIVDHITKKNWLMPIEYVSHLDALGRVAAEDICSDMDISPFDNSAMDGFAIQGDVISNATKENPVTLEIVDWIGAGAVSDLTLEPHQAIRIMTGAIMPEGSDTVVKIEDVELTGEGEIGDTATFTAPVPLGKNVRYSGEEAKKGEPVVYKGDLIHAVSLGLLASAGAMTIPVYARPRVAILSIGSELVAPPEVPGPGLIRDSNAYALCGYVVEAGGIPNMYPIVMDDQDAIREQFKKAIAENDVVISSGGACDGDFDFAIDTVRELGEVLFDYVSIRPGKAQAFGSVGDTLVHVLSGNPAAAAVGFEMFVRPALRLIQGYTAIDRPETIALLANRSRKKEDRAFYQRGHIEITEDGQYLAVQESMQSSALLSELHRSPVLIRLPEGKGYFEPGVPVRCIRLDMEEETVI